MRRITIQTLFLLAGLVFLLVPATQLFAKDKPSSEKNEHHLVIGGPDGHITIDADGPELTITMSEDGKSKVAIVDMEQIGFMVGETMTEITEALSEMQMEFRMGQDNQFTLALDDEEWAVDVDAIMAEVGEALEGAFDDFDTEGFTHHRHFRTIDHVSDSELKEELADLKKELKSLKKELDRLKKLEDDS